MAFNRLGSLFLAVATVAGTAGAQELNLTPAEVIGRLRTRLDGVHFTAKVHLEVRVPGYEEHRDLEVWRDDLDKKRERLMAQFQSPTDLRGMGVLYIEGIDKPNQYFVYQPSQRRVRRIDQSLASLDVYGIDIEYLGFGVAQLQPASVDSMVVTSVDDQPAYLLTEQATWANDRFDQRLMWIDPETFIPIRAEHKLRGKTILISRTLEIESIGGVATPTKTVYERPQDEVIARLTVDQIDYESPIPEIFFSTLQLTKAR